MGSNPTAPTNRLQTIGRASSVKLELGLSNTIPNREGACKASVPASNPWKPGGQVLPIVGVRDGVVVQSLEDPSPLLAALVGVLPAARRDWRCPPLHAVQRQQEVRRHCVSVTLPAWTRTTFRYVLGEPALSESSPLTRLAPSRVNVRLRAMSQNLRSQVLRQTLRLIPRETVVGHANDPSPLPPDPALSWRLRERRAAAPPTNPAHVPASRPR